MIELVAIGGVSKMRLSNLKYELTVARSIKRLTGMSMSIARSVVGEMRVLERMADQGMVSHADVRRYRKLAHLISPMDQDRGGADDEDYVC